MKTRIYVTAVLVAILSVSTTLFVYSHIFNVSEKQTSINQINNPIEKTAPVFLTSMQLPGGPVDLTYAAEHSVQAVVHVRVRSIMAMD